MTRTSLTDAFTLLSKFLRQDEYYIDSSNAYGDCGEKGLKDALELFLEKPHLGFVWIAYNQTEAVGVCMVCFAISTSIGTVVAKLDDVFVVPKMQNRGIGCAMFNALKKELRGLEIKRIDTSVHFKNHQARHFYLKNNFVSLNEEKLSCLL